MSPDLKARVDPSAPARYVVVCRGPSCRERGSRGLRARLGALLRGEPAVGVLGYACFGLCDRGPNVAFYPDGAWYGGFADADAARRLADHVRGVRPLDQPPLALAEADRAQHLRNIAELVAVVEADRARSTRRRWWWPFGRPGDRHPA